MDDARKQQIIDMINDRYFEDIELGLMGRSGWKTTSDISETLGFVFLGISTMISFSAGFFNIMVLSFVAGCVGICSASLFKFASYAMAQSKERTDEINKILVKIGIDKVVDISTNHLTDNPRKTNVSHLSAPVRCKDTEYFPPNDDNKDTIITI